MFPAPKLLLVDANAVIHRAFHALPPMTSPKGEQVNAVYGFAATLLKAIADERPDYLAVCYDVGRRTFRHDIYPDYKATRRETDQALALQIPRTKDLAQALAIPIYAQKGVEADDLVGSLARIAKRQGRQTVIVTGDNDALQLVDDWTKVYKLRQVASETSLYDRPGVKEKLGVYPEQVVDYKALAGDQSDNIPGVPGFGPKTAAELLNKYQTIEGVYQHLDDLSERQRRLLKEHQKLMAISRRLATIKTDLEIELDWPSAATSRFDFAQAIGFFGELGFKSLLGKLPRASIQPAKKQIPTDGGAATPQGFKPQLPFQAIETIDQWRRLAEKLQHCQRLVVNCQTVESAGQLIGVSFAWSENESAFLPLKPHPAGLPLAKVNRQLAAILLEPKIKKIGHNLKDDLHALERSGLAVEGLWFDTMIASGLLNSQLFSHSLDDLAAAELGMRQQALEQLIGSAKKAPLTAVPLAKLAAYACENALIIWRLYQRFQPQLEEATLKRVFYQIEMPLVTVLQKMESQGILLDKKQLAKLSGHLHRQLAVLEEKAQRISGSKFNLASPAQLSEVLFDRLRISSAGLKKTKTGYSTDAEGLNKLRSAHPLVGVVLEYRELAKLLNTYIDPLPSMTDQNGRLHTTFGQLGAATGRLSSSNPNLMNIPVRTDLGNQVRRAFIASPGSLLLGADYSQAELRVVAHFSDDPHLIEAFRRGGDFHQSVGEIMGVDRRTAKTINFATIYGQGPAGLSDSLGITVAEAKQFIDRYFTAFPGVVRYIDQTKQTAARLGYVETLFGRRRYLPDIHSPNHMLRAAAERMAVNSPAQGTVADMMKLAMAALDRRAPPAAKLILQIHDELLLEVEKGAVETVGQLVEAIMLEIVELKVPLGVEIKIGPNWADLAPRR